jgi:hypothetical protein
MSRTTAVVLLLVVCTIIPINRSTSQWIIVRCSEDGTTMRIPKDPSSSYRLYGSRYEASYRSSLKALRAAISKRSATDSLRGILVEFRKYLGKERSAIETQLRKLVTRIQKNPCDSTIRKVFHFLLENIDINARRLEKIAVACRDTSVDLRVLVHDYRRDEE